MTTTTRNLTPVEKRQLGLHTLCTPRTLAATYKNPPKVRHATWQRVTTAAKALGIPAPPPWQQKQA
jgi:hypothetical protein